jgi:hypothetical protein
MLIPILMGSAAPAPIAALAATAATMNLIGFAKTFSMSFSPGNFGMGAAIRVCNIYSPAGNRAALKPGKTTLTANTSISAAGGVVPWYTDLVRSGGDFRERKQPISERPRM